MLSNLSTSAVNVSSFPVNGTNGLTINGSWSPVTIAWLVIQIVIISTNGIALLLFLSEKELRTSFTVYIINLQCVTLLHYALNGFFYVTKIYYQKWIYSNAACTFYLYVHWIVSPWQSNCHVLITLNRLWAVMFPVFYRNHHNKKVAVVICLGVCIISHAYTLPRWIADWLSYRLPVEKYPCVLYCYAMPLMNGMCSVVHFIEAVDEAVILLSFIYIWYKQNQRRRITGQPITRTTAATVKVDPGDTDRADAVTTGTNGETAEVPKRFGNNERPVRKKSSAFVVLAIMSSSVLMFWTPFIVNNTLSVTNHKYSQELNGIFGLLFLLECALDPIFFMLAIKGSGRALKRLFCFVR